MNQYFRDNQPATKNALEDEGLDSYSTTDIAHAMRVGLAFAQLIFLAGGGGG